MVVEALKLLEPGEFAGRHSDVGVDVPGAVEEVLPQVLVHRHAVPHLTYLDGEGREGHYRVDTPDRFKSKKSRKGFSYFI